MSNQHGYPLLGQAFIGSKTLSANFSLTGTDSGKAFTNAPATGVITITLPLSKPGLVYYVKVVSANNIIVQPQAADAIQGSTAGTPIALSGVGTAAEFVCYTPGIWDTAPSNVFSNGIVIAGVPVTTIVTSVTGTANEIVASPTTGAVVLSFAPNVIIPTPASGVALTVNGVASVATLLLKQGSGGIGVDLIDPGANATELRISTTNTIINFQSTAGTTPTGINFLIGASASLQIGPDRRIVVAAPVGAVSPAVQINVSNAASDAIDLVGVSGTVGPAIGFLLGSTGKAFIQLASKANESITGSAAGDLTVVSESANILVSVNGGTVIAFEIHSDGGVTVGSPTGASKGAGTINVATGVFLNGTAYTNP
jgi:hypothetical protein